MKIFIAKLRKGLYPIISIFTENNKDEKWLFRIYFLIYASFSFAFFHKHGTNLPDSELLNYDITHWILRFSESQSLFLLPFLGLVRHPLLLVIYYPLILLTFCLKHFFPEMALSYLFLLFFFNLVAASSMLIIYKYCVRLIQINKFQSLLICILFSLFAHNLLLAIIPETFQLSMFGLLILMYITSDNILTKKEIPISTNAILFCYISGVTISNSLKCIISQLYQNTSLKRKVKSIFISGSIFTSILLFSLLITLLSSLYFFGEIKFYENTLNYFFSGQVDLISEMFFEPIIFHLNYLWGYTGDINFVYNSIYPIIINISIYIILGIAIVIGKKQKVVLLLISSFFIDLLIHIILGFGNSDPYIYSLHWLFIFPLLMGWLFKMLVNNKIKIALNLLLIILISALAALNIPTLFSLWKNSL